MRSRKLNRTLEALHKGSRPGAGAADNRKSRDLEMELLSRHKHLYPPKERWKMILNPGTPLGRVLLTASLLIALGVVACAVPTTYEAEMGKSFSISLPAGTDMPAIKKSLDALRDAEVADEISVSVNELIGESPTVELMLWGGSVDEAEVKRILGDESEAFRKAEWDVTALEAPVESSLAGKMGHHLFNVDLSIDEGDVESARQQIIEQLAAQGLTGDVDIQYMEEDGQQKVEIRLTDVEVEDADMALGEGTLIELKTEIGVVEVEDE